MRTHQWVPFVLVCLFHPAAADAQPDFSTETIDATGNVGRYTSLALDAAGNPHITYLSLSTAKSKYARHSPSGWDIEDIGFGDVTSNRALDLDSHDVPSVVMGISYGTTIATRSNGTWTMSPVGGYGVWWSALDIDGNDTAHIGYMWSIGSGTYQGFISYDSGDIASNLFVPQNPSCCLAIDAHNQPHLLVTPNEPDPMVLWEKQGGNWTQHPLPVGSWGALALDATGSFHMAYYDPVAHDLVYGRRSGGTWAFEPVDQTGDVGKYPSLEIDLTGGVHISHYDVTHGDLKYAHRAAPGGPWTQIAVVEGGDVGEWSSLRVGGTVVHVSYHDRTHGDLKYARASTTVPVRASSLGRVKALYRDTKSP